MAVKKCCIDNCKSCSTRKEDKGVTYHKFPKDVTLRDIWKSVSHNKHIDTDLPMYVCSRHFRKSDFQTYKDSKYVLRTDAVPSIFPWGTVRTKKIMDTVIEAVEMENNASSCNKEDDIESVESIKNFIEAQDREIQEQKETNLSSIEKSNDDSSESKVSQSETLSVANSVIDMIISESELEIAKKKDARCKFISTDKVSGNTSMALSVGSKVEAKDYGEDWYCAEIIEVDYDDMEVLVHYNSDTKKHDEWISVSSPRLRPMNSPTVKPGPSSVESTSSDTMSSTITSIKEEPKEVKVEEKVKPTFVVGEKCLARWRDNRRFVAVIHKDLGNGSYEIIFDDGCHWTCKTSRLYKLRPGKGGNSKNEPCSVSNSSLAFGAGPSDVTPQADTYSVFHTHLFDPTRDYLGSKSERREKKRKLNIKEIFNIGQKRSKIPKIQKQQAPAEKKPRILRKKTLKLKSKTEVRGELKTEIPAVDAVASIIGTISQEIPTEAKYEAPVTSYTPVEEKPEEIDVDMKEESVLSEVDNDAKTEEIIPDSEIIDESDKIELEDLKPYLDPEVLKEEVKLEQFEKPDEGKHEEVIDRIKEAINKLEDGLNKAEATSSPKPEPILEVPALEEPVPNTAGITPILEDMAPEESPRTSKSKKKLYKVKKGKKLRLLREKKVKKQVEKVKNELVEMRKQVAELRKQMLKSHELTKEVLPESYMKPGEWCCKWVNGQPLGTVSEIGCGTKHEAGGKTALPRRSVQVTDRRLPDGWTKHMVRRSLGHSAGKWDVVLVSPDNRRYHTKNEMRAYLENKPELKNYEHALTDFGVHMKLARHMGWISHTPDGVVNGPDNQLSPDTQGSTSPLVKRRSLSLKKKGIKVKNKLPKQTIKIKVPEEPVPIVNDPVPSTSVPIVDDTVPPAEANFEPINTPASEDGFVYVGSLKVQIIENLLRCPAEGCFKNFRNTTLLQMHIKHYHRELREMMGATPKVLDLAYARTMPVETETPRAKEDQKVIKVKIPRPPKPKVEKEEPKPDIKVDKIDLLVDAAPSTPVREGNDNIPFPRSIPRSQDSPKLRQALINKPVKRPRVLLPVRRVEPEPVVPDPIVEDFEFEGKELTDPVIELSALDPLDFESTISTHTVTKPFVDKKRKVEKKKKVFVLPPKGPMSEEEDWFTISSDLDTRSSFPRSGTPDSKVDTKAALVSSESNEENKEVNNMYMYNETASNNMVNPGGERIKIVHMKREEIINCHCGFREEDGLMVQCELCLCWQHALCHNIQRETDVPDKYTCSICLNPRRGRRSRRFLHDQDRLYEGLLPGAKPCESLRRSHELTGNLLRIEDVLHALRVKYYVATKKDHPKLYLWAKDWETQEKLNYDYSDLNIMISSIGKENLPLKADDVKDLPLDIRTLPSEENEHDRFTPQPLLSGLLSSPGGPSLDLPISTSELERLAKSVQEQEPQRASITAPQPEAAIENSACRERLLKHLQRCQALIDARLDSIEAQVAELESQDPSFEDDETADYFPRTKQTIQMMMRDLDTMEELGVIT